LTCSVLAGKVHLEAVGECTIAAEQEGDAFFSPAASLTSSFDVVAVAQSIDFPVPSSHTLGDADFDLGATATSGLAVLYATETPSVCTVTDGKVSLVAVGECSIVATQPGDARFAPASPVERSFEVLAVSTEGPPPHSPPADGAPASGPSSPAPGPPTPSPSIVLRHTPDTPHRPDPVGGPRWTFVFTDAAPGVTYLCRLDEKPFRPCGSTVVYRHLKRGRHTFRVKSVSSSGLESPLEVVRFVAGG
jgi:hypothetical protein